MYRKSRKRYAVSVDISAKIESWENDSMIAVSNGHTRILRIPAAVKAQAASILSRSSGAEPVQFRLMAIFVYFSDPATFGQD